ncbi:hypothetical protein AAU61_03815 [Desulfocarbo indianensis]|nr:hypothetical protein AAU61_03815 [Desulfocarbo indianensis]
MNKTAQKIFVAARQCFFQHGYSKTSLTMIAEQAGVSRVTLYKYYKTKEEIFRAFGAIFLRERLEEFQELLERESDYWRRLERVMHSWVVSPFEAMASDLIISDLMYAHKQISGDFRHSDQTLLTRFLESITQEADDTGQIDLIGTGLCSREVAGVISIMIRGLIDNGLSELRQGVAQIIKFLKVTLQAG